MASRHTDSADEGRTRLDRWLWAARLFKTRSLAQAAVEGGKVHYDGGRIKPGHEVRIGARISVRQGDDDRELVVLALSVSRGPAAVAQELYQETAASLAARTEAAASRRAAALSAPVSDGRPDKRQRRQFDRLQRRQHDE